MKILKPAMKVGKLTWLGIALAALFWALDAVVIDAFLMQKGTPLQQLFSPGPAELWMRCLVAGMMILLGVFSQRTVNQRQQSAAVRRQIEDRFAVFVNSATDCFSLYDSQLNLISANDTAFDSLGANREILIGQNIAYFTPAVRESGRYERYQDVIESGISETTEFEGHHPEFGWRYYISRAFRVEDGLGIIATDITERKLTEKALKRKAGELSATVQELKAENAVRREAEKTLLQTERALKQNASELSATVQELKAENTVRRETEKVLRQTERALKRKAGELSATVQELKAENFVRREAEKALLQTERALKRKAGELSATVQELKAENTVRREAEKALLRSEQNFRLLADNAMDGIAVIAEDHKYLYQNPALTRMFGYTEANISEMPYATNLVHPDDKHRVADIRRRRWAGEDAPQRYEARCITKDSQVITVEIMPTLTEWFGNKAALTFFHDTSDRKRIEADRLKASKLESVGTLAGGIAHDFNNILTGIMGNISLARYTANSGKVDLALLEEAEKATRRATGLTQQLLTFAKGGAPVKKRTDINRLLKEAVGFSLHGSNVKGRYDIPGDLWQANIDEGQLNQVVSNLAINSVQAMPAGGVIRVGAQNVSLKANEVALLGNGNYVKITIADSGTGIPPEILGKVFDPYFTTKGAGSGLGLATSYSVIQKHDGHIVIESKLKVGTTVTFYLAAMRSTAARETTTPAEPMRGSGRVLLMDDEASIRALGKRALEATGFAVEVAADGAAALKLYRDGMKENNPFDVVILDLTVPGGKGGVETVADIREINPEAKVLVSSGYSVNPVMSNYREHGFSGVLNKPYAIEEITHTLSDIIAK